MTNISDIKPPTNTNFSSDDEERQVIWKGEGEEKKEEETKLFCGRGRE
jgi:hypothetical protein